TVITPVFDATGRDILFFVANRGHHADIGGITPGSTPPASRTLEEEGVVLDNFLLVDGARFREAEVRDLLASATYPARRPDGTGAQRDDNFNAPAAVARSAVLYALRCLVGSDIPLNDGCLKPIRLVIPPDTFLSPQPGAAVVAGNTETSQAVVSALLGAVEAA